jgi:hypothetical protein
MIDLQVWCICRVCNNPLDLSNTRCNGRNDKNRPQTCGKCYLRQKAEDRKRKGLA